MSTNISKASSTHLMKKMQFQWEQKENNGKFHKIPQSSQILLHDSLSSVSMAWL